MMKFAEFEEKLKSSIEQTANKEAYKPSRKYKPSSLKCIRNMYYQMIGADIEDDDTRYNLVGICESGTDIHERMQKHIADMKSNGYDCEYIDVETFIKQYNLNHLIVTGKNGEMETKLAWNDMKMSFACDGIILYEGEYHIVELKTETSQKFQTRFDIAPEHRDQARAYSLAFGLPSVWFIYVCRNNSDFRVLEYIPTAEEKQSIVDKIKTCDDYVEKHITPPMQQMDESVCQYCKYKNRCKSE